MEEDEREEQRIRKDLEELNNEYKKAMATENRKENKNEPFNFDNLPDYAAPASYQQKTVSKVRALLNVFIGWKK